MNPPPPPPPNGLPAGQNELLQKFHALCACFQMSKCHSPLFVNTGFEGMDQLTILVSHDTLDLLKGVFVLRGRECHINEPSEWSLFPVCFVHRVNTDQLWKHVKSKARCVFCPNKSQKDHLLLILLRLK